MSITVNDQLNRTVTITSLADGIVSLVPSQTELLFDLGLEHLITGVTKFCIHPEKARRNCTVVGGTKNPDLSTIESLKPGLILANKEENNRIDIEYLSARFPVWVSDVNDLDSALAMINSVGVITQTTDKASELIASIRSAFGALENRTPIPALYVIWNDPVLAAGSDTFINDMMKRAGFTNVIAAQRYPEIRPETLQPEVVLLSSEPFPFAEKHLSRFREMFPNASILLADGTYFSWYGSRLFDAPAYFRSLQHTLLQNRVHTA